MKEMKEDKYIQQLDSKILKLKHVRKHGHQTQHKDKHTHTSNTDTSTLIII
jgi:hypothetical protein